MPRRVMSILLFFTGLLLALLLAASVHAAPSAACRSYTVTGTLAGVACNPWRCVGTLHESRANGAAYTVRGPRGWRNGQRVTVTIKRCW